MHLVTASSGFLLLLISALRTITIAGLAGLAIGILRARTTTLARLFVWRSVLLAALAMPLLGVLLPPTSVPVPRFFQSEQSEAADKFRIMPQSGSAALNSSLVEGPSGASYRESSSTVKLLSTAHPRDVSRWLRSHFKTVVGALYWVVAAPLLLRILVGVIFSRRLLKSSRRITEEKLRSRLLSSERTLRAIPPVFESDSVSVPVTTGILRAAILLPCDWHEWDEATLRAVLAHENSHITRRDSLTQSISLVHRAIFWFSPLAWWLTRHLASLAEEASDEAALAQGADRNSYARTLLEFLRALKQSPRRVWWHGVSMGDGGRVEQRLEKILAWRGSITMHLKKSSAVAIIVLAMPVLYLVASVRPSSRSQQAQSNSTAASEPPAPPAMVPPMPAARREGNSGKAGAIIPVDSAMNAIPVSHFTWSSGQSSNTSEKGRSHSYSYDDGEDFIIVSGKTGSYTMSGSTEDVHHVEKLRQRIPGEFIWFRRDEKSYIIRDQPTIDRARSFWAPQEELARKQEELGKLQEALGKQQEELGKKMEQVRVNIPDMAATLDALKAKLQKLGPTATMDQVGELQSEIGELEGKVGELQSQAGKQQSKLGEEQSRLGEQQSKLGEQQGELGRQQDEAARTATRQMKELLDEAIRKETAKPESEGLGGATL
ncbi:MAG: M48 family metalloprotease [Acidobacteria bacterium]|nr:M48 family metalloprotease [Acidobacteriota bacterium]